MTLRLHEATHDSVAGLQTAVCRVCDHGRNDGVVWTLPRCIHIGVIRRLQCEIRATVLQRESAALGNDGSPESGIVGDDETASIALGVGDAEVDGVRGEGHWCAVLDRVNGFVFGESGSTIGEIGWGK